MAVYKRTYRPYAGSLTAHWSRFLVIPRYTFEELRKSRVLILMFIAGCIAPLFFAGAIYLRHNLSLAAMLQVSAQELITINARFFYNLLQSQSALGFFMAAFVGPGLISPDLTNNALPLYLARPFSRAEYILGKFSVLAIVFSLLTWVPALLLFGLEAYFEGAGWAFDNLRIAGAIVIASFLWIMVVSLLALALSAWVKWKPAAAGLLFGVFFVAAGFGGAINGVLRTSWGYLLNISHLMGTAWQSLFGLTDVRRSGGPFQAMRGAENIPLWCVWAMLFALCGFCLWMLTKKVRGAEEVK